MKNLIIQAQRLGDLVLTFPLFNWLKKEDNKEIFVLAEEKFYKELLRISPEVTYIPTSEMQYLKHFSYHTVINLSHRQDTARLAGELEAQNFCGLREQDSIKQIFGNWQLYRASLTHNNHYNRMHWSELNALDCIPLNSIKKTIWKQSSLKNNGKIGLFVGASEASKRPDIDFWADLAIHLCRKGYDPVFISGPNDEERNIAYQACHKAKIPHGVIPGSLSIFELIAFIESLSLFICPDTGPMHIASFANIPTLNLSLGPVHPWETAPYPSNHYILRSTASCSGCWKCTKNEQLCRNAFIPNRIANLIHGLLLGKQLPVLPQMTLYKSSRNEYGLYELVSFFGNKNYHSLQADFWRYFFLSAFNNDENNIFDEAIKKHAEKLFLALPKMKQILQTSQLKFIKTLILSEKMNKSLDTDCWQKFPPFFRPITSYIQLLLENENYSKDSRLHAMKFLEQFRLCL